MISVLENVSLNYISERRLVVGPVPVRFDIQFGAGIKGRIKFRAVGDHSDLILLEQTILDDVPDAVGNHHAISDIFADDTFLDQIAYSRGVGTMGIVSSEVNPISVKVLCPDT